MLQVMWYMYIIINFTVLDFVNSNYAIGENDISIPICVRLVSGIDLVINGSIMTSNLNARGKFSRINFVVGTMIKLFFLPMIILYMLHVYIP